MATGDYTTDRSSTYPSSSSGPAGQPGKSTRSQQLPPRPSSELSPPVPVPESEPAVDDIYEDPYSLHLDTRTRARQEADAIKAEHEEARFNMQVLVTTRVQQERELAKAKAAKAPAEKLATLEQTLADLDAKSEALGATLAQCKDDMELIKNPASDEAALNAMLGRRGQAGTAAPTTTKGDPIVVDKPFEGSVSDTDETSWAAGGSAINQSTTTGVTVDLDGVSHGTTTTTTAVAGEKSTTNTSSTKRSVGLDGYTATRSDVTEDTDGDYTTSEGKSETWNVGLGGGSKSTSSSVKVGDHEIKDESTTTVTRGDGKLGAGTKRTHTDGLVDEDGALTKGTSTTKEGEAHVIADKDGVGAGGSAKATRETAHGHGIKTGTSAACNGNVIVSVKPYEGESEEMQGRFVVVITVSAGAGVDGSASVGSKSSIGVGGGARASFTLSRQRVMSAEETKAYLAALGAVHPGDAGNGSYPELAQIAAAWKRGWAADEGEGGGELPDTMAEGEQVDYTVEGTVDGKVNAGVDTGLIGLGVEGGMTKTGRVKVSAGMVNGNYVYGVTVESEDTTSYGGSVTVGGVGGKVGRGHGTSSGRGASFTIKPDDGRLGGFRAALKACASQADVDALISTYGDLLSGKTDTDGESTSETIGVTLGGVGVELGGSGAQSRTVETDQDGKQSITDTGSSTGGGSITVADIKIGDSRTESVTTTVDAEGKASGDLSVTETETDIDKSLLAWDDRRNQSPGIADATGSAGPTPVDSTEQTGMLLADADYDRIIGEAGDRDEWNNRAVSKRHTADWAELGRRIRAAAAKGDKAAVGAAMKEFMSTGDHGREELLRDVVRAAHTKDGGAMYDFPDGLGQLKAQYAALVFNDPCAGVTDPETATARHGQLESLWNNMNTQQDAFKDKAALGEMLARIGDRKQQLMKLMGKGDPEIAKARFKELLANCQVNKEQEGKLFASITEAMDDHETIESVHLTNQLRDLYLHWDPAYSEMMSLADVWGFDRNVVLKYRPDHKRWQKAYDNETPTKTEEEEEEEMRTAKDNLAQKDAIYKSSGFHHEAKAFSDAQAAGAAKSAAAKELAPQVAAARQTAQSAAAWVNGASKAGRTVAPAAQKKASDAFARFAQATEQERIFKMVSAGDLGVENGVRVAAGKTIALYGEATALFAEGKALDH